MVNNDHLLQLKLHPQSPDLLQNAFPSVLAGQGTSPTKSEHRSDLEIEAATSTFSLFKFKLSAKRALSFLTLWVLSKIVPKDS